MSEATVVGIQPFANHREALQYCYSKADGPCSVYVEEGGDYLVAWDYAMKSFAEGEPDYPTLSDSQKVRHFYKPDLEDYGQRVRRSWDDFYAGLRDDAHDEFLSDFQSE